MQPIYGREDALRRAGDLLERAARGAGRLLLFTGEPGIGKSRLSEQVAADALERGWAVAWGRCWEAGGAPAYWPWRQVFRSLDMDEDPFADNLTDLALGAAEVRFAAFDRAVRRLKQSAEQQPLLLLLDDLHAADVPSLLLLLLLARELSRVPMVVVGAYRDAELRLMPESAALLGKVAREAEVLPLARLSPEDVAAWLQETGLQETGLPETGLAASDSGAASLYRLTEGHPLLVVEALRLRARGGGASAWPADPGAVLDERLALLPPEAHAVLQVAAVLGREFSTGEVAALGGWPADHVAAALRTALGASILVPAAALEQFRFSHLLLRDRLYRAILPSRRAELHVRAGTQLAQAGDPQAAVHHLFEGAGFAGKSSVPPEQLAQVALAAAEAALSRLAFEDAVSLARRALALAARISEPARIPDRLQSQLQLVLAEALIRLGETAEGKQLAALAAQLAERAGAPELLARAALVYGTELASGTLDDRMIALLRQALELLGEGDSPLRARVLARLAAALTPPRSHADAPEIVHIMHTATALARRLGDRHTLLYVLQLGSIVSLLVPERERLACMVETLELGRALGQRLTLLLTLPAYITTLLVRGERERADAELSGYDQLLLEFPQPLHRIRRCLIGSLMSLLDGDLERVDRASAEAQALVQRSAEGAGRALWLTHRFCLAQLRGRPDLIAAEAPALIELFGETLGAAPFVTWLLAGMGRREEALERLRVLPPAPREPRSAYLMDLMGAAEGAVLLGEVETCRILYPRLLAAADRMFWNLGPGSLFGPTGRMLGDLARLTGQSSQALRHYDEAIAFCERMRAPLLVERCRQGRDAVLPAMAPEPSAAPVVACETLLRETPLRETLLRETQPATLSLRREGDFWTLASSAGALVRLRHSKGVSYLQALLEQPGRQLHVVELAGIDHATGDAGAVLDPKAKAAYRAHLEELRAELAEAESFGDALRAERSSAEIEAITEQLAGAVGLGGRDRRAASDVERARVNVQRRLKDVLERVSAADPVLGRYLRAALETGTYCTYQPL
ncbi:MAG: AAA family ATPase [Deltaproteobacteria bacterium]